MSTYSPKTHRSQLSIKCQTYSPKFNSSESEQSLPSTITLLSHNQTIPLFGNFHDGKFCFENCIHKCENYFIKLYRAMIYVRKETSRDSIDDGIMVEELFPHITLSTNPTSKTELGEKLLTNGYVLVAFSILMGRLYSSQLVFGYLMGLFDGIFHISDNLEDFKNYLQRSLDSFNINNAQAQKFVPCENQINLKELKRSKIGSKAIENQTTNQKEIQFQT